MTEMNKVELPLLDQDYIREVAEARAFSTMPMGPLELNLRCESRERQLCASLT